MMMSVRKCYRVNCWETCDSLKPYYCIYYLSRKQHLLKKQLGNYCECGAKLVKVRYNGKPRRICFACERGVEAIRKDVTG